MTRKSRQDIEFSPECGAAYERLIVLAHRLSALLTGDALSPDGLTDTPRSQALAMSMIFFLLRAGPDDLHAMFFAEGSFNQLRFKPLPADFTCPPVLADVL
ncbi:hypothetical protein [Mesorhizobium sp. WSM2239]|uniref:AraC family transcriptional regulator n=2 Tax=unclassified Mesorhizobium TaxID=325217 RepID=A0AAU8D3W0_9HYPH